MTRFIMLLCAAVLCVARTSQAFACQYGESVNYDPSRTFHLDVLVVGDGARAYDAIARYGNDAGQVLYKTVGRYFGPITVTYYLNLDASLLPRHLSYLIGNGFCMGTTPVLSDGAGWSRVTVSVPAKAPGVPTVNGQIALVLPRAPLVRLHDREGRHISFTPAVSVDIPTKYNAPIIQGRFAGQPSMQIARPSGVAGVSWVEKRILDGEKGSLFYFVYGRD